MNNYSNKLDKRKKEDFYNLIAKKAKSYVPEWNFDRDNPDVGAAIALTYADMFYDTVDRYNRVFFKNKISFLNMMDASIMPAVPSKNYVCFSMPSADVESKQVPSGTALLAMPEENGDPIRFETTEDVLVISSKINDIYQADEKRDYIYCRYSDEDRTETELTDLAIKTFSHLGENLQKHELYISHDYVFELNKTAIINLNFMYTENFNVSHSLLEELADTTKFIYEYSSGNKFVPFKNVSVENSSIALTKNFDMPPFEKIVLENFSDKETCYIRITAVDEESAKKVRFSSLMVCSREDNIEPELIYGDGVECNANTCMAFGDSISAYKEFYLGSKEVLSKKGSMIEMSFFVSFDRIALEGNDDEFQYEWVMKKEKYKPMPFYDVSIAEIVWEYYNGNGWTRLFKKAEYSDIFNMEKGDNFYRIKFVCPQDITEAYVGASESFFIRARITKVLNPFKTRGFYICPVLHGINFSFDYNKAGGANPVVIRKYNSTSNLQNYSNEANLERNTYDIRDEMGFVIPFRQMDNHFTTMYFGLKTKPEGAPVRLLFQIEEVEEFSRNLKYEYFEKDHWKPLSVLDETMGFSRTGLLSCAFTGKMTSKNLFGKERYWIRAYTDVENKNKNNKAMTDVACPVISGIYMNSTKAANREETSTEIFGLEYYQKFFSYSIGHHNIISLDLYVNENLTLSPDELAEFQKLHEVVLVRDEFENITETWVKWTRVEKFTNAKSDDRIYVLNVSDGVVFFGDDINGRIPPVSNMDNIKVIFQCGGGENTNVKKGEINILERQLGYINGVTNPFDFNGGYDVESVADAIERNSNLITRMNRMVVTRDYEETLVFANRCIKQVKAYEGINYKGESEGGALTLVILVRDKLRDSLRFSEIKNDIMNFLEDKISASLLLSGKLYIIQPVYVKLNVYVDAVIGSFDDVFRVKMEIEECIKKCIDPDEMEINYVPDTMKIQTDVEALESVNYVKKTILTASINNGSQKKEISIETLEKMKFKYILNGNHTIDISIS